MGNETNRHHVILVVGGFPTPEAPNRCIFNQNAAEDLAQGVDLTVVFLRMWQPARRFVKVEQRRHGPLITLAVPALPWFPAEVVRETVTTVNTVAFWYFGRRLLARYLRRCQVIHSVGAHLAGVVASRWSSRFDCAHVAQCIGSDINSVLPVIAQYAVVRGWERFVDAVACNSRALTRSVENLYPGMPNVRSVYRGVDLDVFSEEGPRKGPLAVQEGRGVRFFYLGGLPNYPGLPWGRDTKGGLTLMSAWAESEGVLANLGARLLFAGPEADLEKSREWRGSLRRPDLVEVMGAIPPEDVPGYLRAAEVVLLPSREEGLPNVAMEASACSRPVIGSDVGGTTEVVEDGVTGWIVEPGSPKVLAEAMVQAGADLDRVRRLGGAARARMERLFDRRSYGPSMMALYRLAMAHRGAGGR